MAESEFQSIYNFFAERRKIRKLRVDFLTHVYGWHQETAVLSSMTAITENAHYQAIIAMGAEALPFIFERLQHGPDFFFTALRIITGEDPVDPEDAGKLDAMTASWLAWAEEHGYLSEEN